VPKRPSFPVRQDARTGSWLVEIAASVAGGKKRSETYPDERQARARAKELAASVGRERNLIVSASADLVATAALYEETFQLYGFDGLRDACEAFAAQLEKDSATPTLRELVGLYLAKYDKPSNAVHFRQIESRLTEGIFDRRVSGMTTQFWEEEFASLRIRKGLSPKTLNMMLVALRGVFDCGVERKRIEENPLKPILMRELEAKSVRVIEPEQLRRLMARAVKEDSRMAVAFAVLFFGGLRPIGEFSSKSGVRWDDIDWESGTLRIRDTKNSRKTGAVHRYVTLNPTLRSWLVAFRRDSGRLCPYASTSKFQERRAELCKGIIVWSEGLHDRDLSRHSFGSYLAASEGKGQIEVMKEMGHTNPATFRRHYENARKPSQAAEYWSITYESIATHLH
jgi:integrase